MKQKGFALMMTVLTTAIALGIFFNFSRATRSKKKMMQSSLSNQTAEKSVQETNGIAAYEMFLADQMITANNLQRIIDGVDDPKGIGGTLTPPLVGEATAIQNIVGYFTVKNSTNNINTLTDQVAAIKVWEQLDNGFPIGEWYYGNWTGTSPNFVFTTYKYPVDSFEIPMTKGGYIITGITDITNKTAPNNLFSVQLDQYKTPVLNISGNRVKYLSADGTPRGKIDYKPGAKAAYEVNLYKNITLFKKKVMDDKTGGFETKYNFNEIVRSYNAYVTLEVHLSSNTTLQANDTNVRNNCSAAPNPLDNNKYDPLVGADCGVDSSGEMIVSKITSFVLEDITPVVE